jgi:hypothetical protein
MKFRGMKTVFGVVALAGAVVVGWVAKSRADNVPPIGQQLVYAGVVVDANTGAPLTGTHNVALTITGNSNANQTCNGGSANTTFTQGHFSAPLGDGCANVLRNNAGATVDVIVDGTDFGAQKTTAVPYALQVESTNDWQSFTPQIFCTDDVGASSATIANNTALFRRVGDTLEIEYRTNFNASPCAGELGWTMPTGFAPKLAKMPAAFASVVGWGTIDASGILSFMNCKVPSTFNQVKCTKGGNNFVSDSDVGTGVVNFHVRIPVQ